MVSLTFRCYIYLANLFFGVTQEHRISVIDRNGRFVGFVRVRVEPLITDETDTSNHSSPLFAPSSEGGQRKGHSKLLFKDAEYFEKVR